MKKNERILIIVSLVIVLAFCGWYWYRTSFPPSPYRKALPSLSAESRAKIPAGFPRFLILGNSVSVLNGVLTVDVPGEKVFHLTISASGNPVSLSAEYEDFFTRSGWKVSRTARRSGVMLTARRGLESVAVVFTIKDMETTQATITYTVRTP